MGKVIRMGEYLRRGFLEPSGDQPPLFDWIFSTDHKRIGLLYLYSISAFFAVGVTLGLLIRLELLAPGRTIMGPETYNALFTLHGVVMIFLFIIPGIPAAFGNIMLPLQIGARDVAFPRLNLFSWWLYLIGAMMVLPPCSAEEAHPTPAGLSTCLFPERPPPTYRWPCLRSSSSVFPPF